MPLYEYLCRKCGSFEVIRKFKARPLAKCPTCGGKIQKLPSAPAIQFKGTGWYITDYARKSGGEEGKKEGASKDGGSAKDKDGGSAKETKPAPESASTPAASESKDSPAKGGGKAK